MGVPKFFRYISERYPCLSELVRENQIPQFDNLYLDMNGIIHVCSHPDDTNVLFRISEEQIFKDVFFYIEVLFRLIQPQKLLFMAIDGVAPRAKMNQQRGRRFRTAKEAELLEAKARNKGEVIPSQSRFDSNCITPGTEFMVRLQIALKYFIQAKISANPIWQKCRVILSGHETPGEGEHKIMEYIRYLKSRKNYDPNTRHCLYGLDADLIMLGLCSHELHFSLLREEVKFSKKSKRAVSADETSFYLLHLGLLREYLELEFKGIENKLSFPYDKEKIIDDWVFLGFLVGNDFIPHLPNLHINSNALPILYNTYMEILPKIDGYINNNGWLNLKRLEVFMETLADVDRSLFAEQYADLKYFHLKTSQDSKVKHDAETFDFNIADICVSNSDNDLLDLVKATEEMFTDDLDDMDMPYANMEDDDKFIEQEFLNHKRDYYINKLKYPEMTPEVLSEQTECYIRALQWTLSYYYHGVQSWGWFYPHHYAPYISDIKLFSNLKIDFTIGTPFLPYQQLLAVLPAASKELLPKAYRDLMTNQNSELIEYYPTEFLTDLNGKKQEWEAVVLIPLIDEEKLLKAMNKCDNALTDEERKRNIHGPMIQYDYSNESEGVLKGLYNFPCMPLFAKKTLVTREEIYVPENQLVFESLKGSLGNVYFPGFPTMKHLHYTCEIKKLKVKVFDQPSRNDNLIIQVVQNDAKETDALAKELLGKEIFVGWPHLREAKVIRISDKAKSYNCNGEIKDNEQRIFHMQAMGIIDHHLNRMGIELGDITQLVHVNLIAGREYVHTANGKMTLQKTWDNIVVVYPAQTIVKDIAVHSPDFVQFTTFEKIYSPGSIIFMLSDPHYGSQGEIIDPELIHKFGRIKISLYVHPVPDFTSAIKIHNSSGSKYFNSYNAASRCQINHNVLSRISGTVLVVQGEKRNNLPESIPKINIGLQLKFVKNNEEIVGYTKKVGSQWLYSELAIELINSYCDKYPEIVEQLSKRNNFDLFFEAELFPNKERQISVNDIAKWIKEQPHYNADRRTCGTQTVEKETVEAIIEAVTNTRNDPIRRLTLQAKPYLLYKPGLKISSKQPDENAKYELFDRVVIARNAYTVPIGFKGTIISISRISDPNPVRQECLKTYDMYYEVLFDHPFPEGNSFCGIANKCVYKVPQNVLINLTYGSSDKLKEKNCRSVVQQPFIEYVPAWKTFDEIKNETQLSGINKQSNVSSTVEIITKVSTDKTPIIEEQNKEIAHKTSLLKKKEKSTIILENNIKHTIDIDDTYEQIWSNMKQKISPFPLPTFNAGNINNNMIITPNPSDSTDMLKKLLGLKAENKEKAVVSAVENSEQQIHQKINLAEMFDKFKTQSKPVLPITKKLPAPPENWRISTSKKKNYVQTAKPTWKNNNQNYSQNNNNNNDISYQSRQNFVQYNNSCGKRDPFFLQYDNKQNKNYFEMEREQDHHQKQFNYNYQNSLQKPNGPQTLRDDNNTQLGHGAFIPLQVTRSHSKPKSVQPAPTHFVQRNAEQRQIIQQKQEESRQNFASFIINSSSNDGKDNFINPVNQGNRQAQTKSSFIQKPRSSRIAANFNIRSTK